MIIVRYTFTPSTDVFRARDLCVQWRDAHPEQGWRVYNTVTGKQAVLALEVPYANDDLVGLGQRLFDPGSHLTPEEIAWWRQWSDLDISWDTRELWRLVD